MTEPEILVSVCYGLVTINTESGVIRLVHYTTEEYFERKRDSWFEDAHDQLAVTCATYLRMIPPHYNVSTYSEPSHVMRLLLEARAW